MFFLEQDLIYSASDLVTAASCEFTSLSKLDEKLGRSKAAKSEADEMLERTAKLGDTHEHKVLGDLLEKFGEYDSSSGRGVKMLQAGVRGDRTSLEQAHQETLDALRMGADVVFQATFFDGEFVGFADFLIREDNGAYAVWDTKLARHPRVTALLQLAAYGDQLLAAGVEVAPHTTLVLGDNSHSVHRMHELLPVFRDRRNRFKSLVEAHQDQEQTVAWGQPGISACGRCDYCSEQVANHRDLLSGRGNEHLQAQEAHGIGHRHHRRAGAKQHRVPGHPLQAGGTGPHASRSGRQRRHRRQASPTRSRATKRFPGCPSPTPGTSSSTSRATRSGRTPSTIHGVWNTSSASSKSTPKHPSSSRSGPTRGPRNARPSPTSSPTSRTAGKPTRT